MKIYKKLSFNSDPKDDAELYQYLITQNKDWKYDVEKSETYASGIGEKKENALAFFTKTKAGRNVYFWIVKSKFIYQLTNITPDQTGKLTIDEYNEIVDDFVETILNKCGVKVQIEGVKGEKSISEIAGEEVYQALNKWAKLCNPSTGNTNPYDEERWMDFVILCYKNNSNLDSYYLERYLKENTKIYDEELIFELIHDFEYGISLLKRNDEF